LKLLFDQNISFRVAARLKSEFPSCAQVRELALEDKSDREIWEYAKKEGFTIVTFDADFFDLVTLYGHPPKVVWLRVGNTSTENLITVLQKNTGILTAFITDANQAQIGCLEIHHE
jgi:predicted nuclease of predicted toxin-antitoxin system